jgi:two-component SAPR family response regulator
MSALGFSVIGPFSRLPAAMVAAVHDEIDAGIIDVNLGGELVYPVADVLTARKIPFVFVTGYGVQSIDPRFAYVPIVKKPVQRQVLQRIFGPAGSGDPATLPKCRVGRAATAGRP